MIHGAFIEVTCDAPRCISSEWVELDFVYPDYSGKNGLYDHDDKNIEEKLTEDHEWVVIDGVHCCCEDCAEGEQHERWKRSA